MILISMISHQVNGKRIWLYTLGRRQSDVDMDWAYPIQHSRGSLTVGYLLVAPSIPKTFISTRSGNTFTELNISPIVITPDRKDSLRRVKLCLTSAFPFLLLYYFYLFIFLLAINNLLYLNRVIVIEVNTYFWWNRFCKKKKNIFTGKFI